jgi:cytochrome c553
MRMPSAVVLAAVAAAAVAAAQAPSATVPPPWAYVVPPPAPAGAAAAAAPADDGQQLRIPGSSVALTRTQLRDLFNPPDWHPENHPPPPEVVAHGRRPDVRACGYCHYPNGQGRPENASLAGQPVAYLMQQMADFRSGARASAEPTMRPPAFMAEIARAATVEEDRAAAEYFAAVPYRKWIRVVETADVPVMRVAGGVFVPAPGGAREPLGARIVETPEDVARAEVRDSSIGFIAYVPVGSVKKGEALVATGGAGRTVACATCHGADLRGLGPVPGLAGRSTGQTVRALYDFQRGTRKGPWAALMKAAVEKLTVDELMAIAAYTASREP